MHVVRGFVELIVFLVASTPRLTIWIRCCSRSAHWSNFQLTRVELSTLNSTTEIVISSKEKLITPRFHNLVLELEGVWKSRDKERGKRGAGGTTFGGQGDKRSTTQDNQWTSRRCASSRQVQSKCQTDEDRTDKSRAMKTDRKKSAGRSR